MRLKKNKLKIAIVILLNFSGITMLHSQINLSPAGIALLKKTLVSCNVLKIDSLRGSYTSNCSGTLSTGTHTVDVNWGDLSPNTSLSISIAGMPNSAIYYFTPPVHTYPVGNSVYTVTINSGFNNVTCSSQSGNFTMNSLPFFVTQTITCSGVGIEENKLENIEIFFYPNPAKSVLNINSSIILNNVQIVNPLGQIVLSKNNINDLSIALDINALPNGIYIAQFQTTNGTLTKKIIKE